MRQWLTFKRFQWVALLAVLGAGNLSQLAQVGWHIVGAISDVEPER